jgi:hypothetical protein
VRLTLQLVRQHQPHSRQLSSQLVSQTVSPFVPKMPPCLPPSPHSVQALASHFELHSSQSPPHVPLGLPHLMHVLPHSPLGQQH